MPDASFWQLVTEGNFISLVVLLISSCCILEVSKNALTICVLLLFNLYINCVAAVIQQKMHKDIPRLF